MLGETPNNGNATVSGTYRRGDRQKSKRKTMRGILANAQIVPEYVNRERSVLDSTSFRQAEVITHAKSVRYSRTSMETDCTREYQTVIKQSLSLA